MGLSNQFVARVTGKGANVINRFLMNWQLVDAAGHQSDQLTLTVAAPSLDSLPVEGEQLGFSWGDVVNGKENLIDKGQYTITRITPKLWPHQVTIVATAAQFQVADQTEFKRRRSQTWENTTVGAIFRELVNRHNLSPRISSDLDGIAIQHIDQTDETDMAFLTRLARKYDAVAKPIDKLYVMGRRGQLKSITGQSLQPVTFSLPENNQPTSSSFINASVDFPSRRRFSGVWGFWLDQNTGEEKKVSVGEFPFKRLTQRFESEAIAKQQCESELRKLSRTGSSVRLDVPANPHLTAEGLIELNDTFPVYMMGKWSLDKVVTNGSVKNGTRTTLHATQPQN